jgi:hypothetical protein
MNGTPLLIWKAHALYFAILAWETPRWTGTIHGKTAIQKSSSTRQTDLQISFTQEVKRKFTNVAIGSPSRQGMVTLRRRRPKSPWILKVAYQDSKRRNWVTEVSATRRCFLMVNGASMKMYEANPLNKEWDRVYGGKDLREAIESDRQQHDYHEYRHPGSRLAKTCYTINNLGKTRSKRWSDKVSNKRTTWRVLA